MEDKQITATCGLTCPQCQSDSVALFKRRQDGAITAACNNCGHVETCDAFNGELRKEYANLAN